MVKHNNVIPNVHFHKKHIGSSRGPLKAKLALDQASKKKSRRLARAARAAAIAPRPLRSLKPIVRCPTQKYSAKTRLGRGFTLQEIKAAGMTPKYARTVGISVDHRRTNRSAESLNANVERLKAYKANLVVFPRKRLSVAKNGDSTADECKAATQLTGTVMPIVKAPKEIEMMDVTADMKDFKAYTTMRVARKETRVDGYRIAAENAKKKD